MKKKLEYSGIKVLILEGYSRQSLPMIRAFRKLGCNVTVLCAGKLDVAYASRLPHKKIIGICNPDNYDESERYICNLIKSGEFDIVVPMGDFGAKILSHNKEELKKFAKIASNDKEVFDITSNKLEVMKICNNNNISHPQTVFNFTSVEDICKQGLKFPIILKPKSDCGGRGFIICNNEAELLELKNIDKNKYFVQEYIPIDSKMIAVQMFVDNDFNIKSTFMYESPRFYPLKGGTGTLNILFYDEEIKKSCENLVNVAKLKGCVGVDLIIDKRDNVAKVLEINPRIIACAQIGFLAGINLAQQILEKEFDKEVTSFVAEKKKIRVRVSQIDLLWFIKSKERFKSKPSWFNICNTRDQMFYFDDPLPWFAFLLNGLKTYKKRKTNKDV